MYYNDFCPCNWQFWLKVKKITNFGWFYWIFLQKSYFRNSAERKASNKNIYLVTMTYFCVSQWLLPIRLAISKFSWIRTTLLDMQSGVWFIFPGRYWILNINMRHFSLNLYSLWLGMSAMFLSPRMGMRDWWYTVPSRSGHPSVNILAFLGMWGINGFSF